MAERERWQIIRDDGNINVEIFVDYGDGNFVPDGGVEFDAVLDFAIWKNHERTDNPAGRQRIEQVIDKLYGGH